MDMSTDESKDVDMVDADAVVDGGTEEEVDEVRFLFNFAAPPAPSRCPSLFLFVSTF